jgi:ADP-ribosyl-[dinitrogen reductase] hydrolase
VVPSSDRDRVRGALLGLAVGDALGAPLEQASPAVAATAVAGGLEMSGGGWWAPGEWTDDTAMALALAESIGARGLLDTDDVAQRYIAWASSDGKGIGRSTRAALAGAADADDARTRARAHHETTGLAAGNGTVMRATPIGLVATDVAQAVDAARRDAQLTHGDPAAGVASAALCAALLALRAEVDPLAAAREQAAAHETVAAALDLSAPDPAALAGRASGPEAGACWMTLALALHALASFDDYAAAVRWVIGLGGDTDTNAAVTGALFGARDGEQAIPPRWLASLHDHERIERAAEGLLSRQPR